MRGNTHIHVRGLPVRRPVQRRGTVLVLVAILLIVLLGMVALAFDFGYMYWTAQKLQNAADAAAMAGAGKLKDGQPAARNAAVALAGANEAGGDWVLLDPNNANDPEGDVVLGRWSPDTGFSTSGTVNAVRVRARRTDGSLNGPVPTFFGQVLGFTTVSMTREAIAMAEGGPGGPGILLLAPDGIGVEHSGNGNITVDGSIYINSKYKEALSQSGNGKFYADSYEVVGQIKGSTSGLPGEWNTGVDPMPDPYIDLPVPKPADHVLRSSSKISGNAPSGGRTLQPGRYRGGFDLGDGTWNFEPGIYIIEGGGFKVGSSKAVINAQEVMIYNAGTNINSTTGELGTSGVDQISMSADSKINWSPPKSGTWEGFCIFQHRQVDHKVQISGNGGVMLTGIIYAASAEVQLSGNGTTDILGGGMVARSLQVSGDGSFTVLGNTPGGRGYENSWLVW